MKIKKIPLLCVLFISFLGIACDKDDNIDLSGSWQLISQTWNGEEQELDECAKGKLLYFAEKNVCYLYLPCEQKDLRTAWNYDGDNRILNISDLLPITFYVEERSDNRLVLKHYTYSATGQLDTYIETYKAVETVLEDGKLRLKESY
ncbi:lipocalin family protein [Bacteroides sp. K03]|uniref:lipocalin family protein n=1 Tax=Bacteroides TaxID=816 RepID=UPI001C8BA854|nr:MULTISPECIES: lipocalin family protein [Bacteroides]MBX9187443.1 lipocalin family protein [Bacteroides sp. K03]